MDTPLAIELLHHAMAVRALAHLLVSDQHADDLVQDVALQALRSPPPSPVGLRAFLQTVTRRVASNHRRGERRRRQREADVAAVARDERWHAPSPADVVAQQEQVQRVVAALLALPEPYRDVLFRRFFHDATPTAIADECRVPVATVKSQLQRGLAMLRERLDASERPDWREALVAGVGLERIAVVGSGGIGVGLVLQLALAAVVLVLIGQPLASKVARG
jgi:RNA polymerase sigma factor (sigma-70 family)